MADYGSLPFAEAIAFFRQKQLVPTNRWDDFLGQAHDHGFMVAGANKMALVADLQSAVQQAIEGGTLEQFRKDFDGIVRKNGWTYRGERGWRTRIIYDTNLRQAYNAGREAQWADNPPPYFRYQHGDSANPRPQHLAWNGLVLRADDPWWATHSPQNGWGCKCSKRPVYARDLERLGKAGPDQAPPIEWVEKTIGQNGPNPRTVRVPKGIDPGFGYRPGESWRKMLTPEPRDGVPEPFMRPIPDRRAWDALPAPRPFDPQRLLPRGLTDEEYIAAFLRPFGAGLEQAKMFLDAVGEPLLVSSDLFLRRATGAWKVQKNGREAYLPMLAETIIDPDEIWVAMEWQRALSKVVLRRRYIARWHVGEARDGIAVFEHGADGWAGITAFPPFQQDYVEMLRQGVRLFRRK